MIFRVFLMNFPSLSMRTKDMEHTNTSPGTGRPRLFSRPLALVVEPEDAAAEIAMGMLDLLGYDLARVTTGASALETIAEQEPALVLLTVELPDLPAGEVLRILGRTSLAASTILVAVSAKFDARSPQVEAVRAHGVSHFLSAPFTVRHLRDTLSRAHPSGPVDGYEVLGTTSNSFELPSYDSMVETASTESFEELAEELVMSNSFVVGSEPEAAAPVVWSLSLAAAGTAIEAELDRVVGDELHVRTWGERLAKGAVVEIRIELKGEEPEELRYHGEVVRTTWRFAGGRSRIAVRATVPADALKRATSLLECS